MKIMGKRVNFSARSVISPDPYLDSDEIGLPLFIAKTLTFPERVNSQNMELMKQRVKNGPHIYPGALELTEKHIKKILDNSTTE
jgi:DNA-directed RNA polymerase beta' subunit